MFAAHNLGKGSVYLLQVMKHTDQSSFCGTTKEFCGDGCSSGCDAVDQPYVFYKLFCKPDRTFSLCVIRSCSGTSSEKVYAGYFEAWNYQHACDNLEPKNIDVTPWTVCPN